MAETTNSNDKTRSRLTPRTKTGKAVAAKAVKAHAAVKRIPTPPVKSKVHGFAEFIRKQGVVGLAVGLAIGTQASELVKNIVSSIITPMVDLVAGKEGLKGLTYFAHLGDRTATFNFGLLIDSTIKFVAVAAVIYFVIMGLRLDKLDKKKD
jgi:large conductance mechanosensitive channel